jgi:hypothetical protein
MSSIDYRIVLPYAVFAITTKDSLVIDAAPIGKWMIGKPLSIIMNWVESKQGKIRRLR